MVEIALVRSLVPTRRPHKGTLSKAEAEAILRKAIEAVKTEGAGEQAAELLAGILERLSNFQPAPRK